MDCVQMGQTTRGEAMTKLEEALDKAARRTDSMYRQAHMLYLRWRNLMEAYKPGNRFWQGKLKPFRRLTYAEYERQADERLEGILAQMRRGS